MRAYISRAMTHRGVWQREDRMNTTRMLGSEVFVGCGWNARPDAYQTLGRRTHIWRGRTSVGSGTPPLGEGREGAPRVNSGIGPWAHLAGR